MKLKRAWWNSCRYIRVLEKWRYPASSRNDMSITTARDLGFAKCLMIWPSIHVPLFCKPKFTYSRSLKAPYPCSLSCLNVSVLTCLCSIIVLAQRPKEDSSNISMEWYPTCETKGAKKTELLGSVTSLAGLCILHLCMKESTNQHLWPCDHLLFNLCQHLPANIHLHRVLVYERDGHWKCRIIKPYCQELMFRMST